MKKQLTLLFTLFLMISGFAQSPIIEFQTEEHDFGVISEENGPVSYDFTFTNKGKTPLIIQNVKASCGCTTPNWSKEPILPGKTGKITATYDPANRPNVFNKTITVTSNADVSTKILKIKGDVKPKPKALEDEYRTDLGGGLRAKSIHMAFGRLYNTETGTQEIELINTSEKPITISFPSIPSHIKLEATKMTIQPGEISIIKGIYDAKLKNDWGFVMDRVEIKHTAVANSGLRISISATIEEDFRNLTQEQKDNAPKIEYTSNEMKFDTIMQGEKVDFNFKFKNTGKSDLIIRKVKASCGCTATKPEKSVIKPGETSNIAIAFNSSGKKNMQNKSITITTNDPSKSSIDIRIKGFVKAIESGNNDSDHSHDE